MEIGLHIFQAGSHVFHFPCQPDLSWVSPPSTTPKSKHAPDKYRQFSLPTLLLSSRLPNASRRGQGLHELASASEFLFIFIFRICILVRQSACASDGCSNHPCHCGSIENLRLLNSRLLQNFTNDVMQNNIYTCSPEPMLRPF